MRLTSAGDLGRSFNMNQAYARTKSQLDVLIRESASGLRSDVAASAGGDTRPLAGIEGRLRRLDALDQAATEVALRLDTAQEALTGMRSLVKGSGVAMLSAAPGDRNLDMVLVSAEADLRAALGYLNTDTAGQFVFAGGRSSAPPVVGLDALMGSIDTVTAGLTDAATITAAVASFFDRPAGSGGYLDLAFNGSADPVGPVPIGTGAEAVNPLTAAAPEFREMLKGMTLAVVAKRGFAGDGGEREALTRMAGQTVLSAEDRLIAAASRLGAEQEGVAAAQARTSSERSSLETARNRIVTVDPYETATALEASQSLLETLYALTARLSRMSLADRL